MYKMTLYSILIALASPAFALESQAVTFLVHDDNGKRIANAILAGACEAEIQENGFFSKNTFKDSTEYSCATNDAGECVVNIKNRHKGKIGNCIGVKPTTLKINDREFEVKSEPRRPGISKTKSTHFNISYDTDADSRAILPHGYFVLLASANGVATSNFTDKQDFLNTSQKHTIQNFRSKISVEGDDLEPVITITTRQAHPVEYFGDTNFIRAMISKKSGEVVFQIYVVEAYAADSAEGFANYNIGKYLTTSGATSSTLTNINKGVECGRPSPHECIFTEHVALSIPFDAVREIARGHTPSIIKYWNYRLTSQSGKNIDQSLPYAEIAAVASHVESILSKLGK